jgi:hypothetical protein
MRRGRAFRRRDGRSVVGHSSLQALVSDIAKTRCTNVWLAASKGSENLTRCLTLEHFSLAWTTEDENEHFRGNRENSVPDRPLSVVPPETRRRHTVASR